MAFMVCESNGYIIGIGKNKSESGGITETEYNQISELFKNKPSDTDGYQFKLRSDTLEWERVSIEPEPVTDEQALTRYANELTGQNDPDLISAAETLIKQRKNL